MPDFDFRLFSGVDTRIWDDDRIDHRNRVTHRYRRVRPPTAGNVAEVVIKCTIGTDIAPLDAALGGRLFFVHRLVWSGPFPFGLAQAAGQSSLITMTFTSEMLGHQELLIRRPDGGSIALSVEVEAPRTSTV